MFCIVFLSLFVVLCLFCFIAGNKPASEPNMTARRFVEAAIIGSTPKNIINGNLIAPRAIPKSPPKNPIREHSTRRTRYI